MANREREISGLTRSEFGRLAVGPTDGGREREGETLAKMRTLSSAACVNAMRRNRAFNRPDTTADANRRTDESTKDTFPRIL